MPCKTIFKSEDATSDATTRNAIAKADTSASTTLFDSVIGLRDRFEHADFTL